MTKRILSTAIMALIATIGCATTPSFAHGHFSYGGFGYHGYGFGYGSSFGHHSSFYNGYGYGYGYGYGSPVIIEQVPVPVPVQATTVMPVTPVVPQHIPECVITNYSWPEHHH